MSIAATANGFNFDVLFMARSGEKQIVIAANDVDFVGMGLSLLNLFLIAIVKILDFFLGWLDIPLAKVRVALIWFKHLSKGLGGELWTKLSPRKTSAWA